MRRTSDQSMAAGFQTVVWQVTDFDDVAGFDGVSSYTVDRSGLYLISGRVGRMATATSQSLIAAPAIDGTRLPTTRVAASTTTITGGSFNDLVELVGGTVLTLQCQGHASAAWTLYGAHTAMSVVRVGPVAWT